MALDRQALLRFLENRLGIDPSEVDDETPLFSSGLVDSVALAELIVYVENESGISFQSEDITLDHLDTVGRILDFVAARHGG
jgi:acyl carrier protein